MKKRFSKILLIWFSQNKSRYDLPLSPSASLGYLAESVKAAGLEYDVIDLALGYTWNDVVKKIEDVKPDIVGGTLFSFHYAFSYDFFKKLKTTFPEIATIVGGPHPSIIRERILREVPEIDYSAVGEAEKTLTDLMLGVPLEVIKGLVYRDGSGTIKYHGLPAYEENLDSIPFPTFDKFELDKYLEKRIPLLTSRGCPYQCIYCTAPKIAGHRVRYRTPRNILTEVRYWTARGYRNFPILDDNFILKKQRAEEFCDLMIAEGAKDVTFYCPNGVRADSIDKPLIQKMLKAGFGEVAIGAEVGNDKMLKAIKKGETLDKIENAIKIACDEGMRVTLFFIIGSPSETMADFMDSVKLALKYPIVVAHFFNIIPLPDTELMEYVSKNNLFLIPPEKYLNETNPTNNRPVFITPEMGLKDRLKAFQIGKRTSRMVIRNYFLHKFKNKKVFCFFVRIAPLRPLLYLYWNNTWFRKIIGMFRYSI